MYQLQMPLPLTGYKHKFNKVVHPKTNKISLFRILKKFHNLNNVLEAKFCSIM